MTDRPPETGAACVRCAHYYITHDARFPYGCQAMGYKSRQLPEREVRAATGAACLMFVAKAAVRPESE